ncbi:MAG: NTP transferase domain-containing protein, partial [Eubacteriaceae bacterium]|nr:NTP transferase domain-containing protein [Eubacteriaceae bacterium]
MASNICAVALAAGLGTRMKSKLPKALREICYTPMVGHVGMNLSQAGIADVCYVLGYGADQAQEYIESAFASPSFAYQKELLGTAHALMAAQEFLSARDGKVLVCCGDAPFLFEDEIRRFADLSEGYDAAVLTARADNPFGFGRIIRNGSDLRIVEENDATESEKKVTEINTGAYIFDIKKLLGIFPFFTNDNKKGEYYLTQALSLFQERQYSAVAIEAASPLAQKAANTLAELADCEAAMRLVINSRHMANGVAFQHPTIATVSREAEIGAGTVIYGDSQIYGPSVIGEENEIRGSRINSCTIGHANTIENSVLEHSTVGSQCTIGPFAHLRPGASLKDSVRVGNYVEIKNSAIDSGSKLSHFAYIGDSEVGENVNIGCF